MPLRFIDRLQRRFGWLGVPHVTLALIVGQALLFYASYVANAGNAPLGISLDRIALDPAKVMQGEVWRLVTFLFAPPRMDAIFAVFYFLLLYRFGSTLEEQWGSFRFNLFLLIGYVANVAAAFVAYFLLKQQLGAEVNQALQLASLTASNGFLYASIFLAFARLYPDYTLNLYFLLPIKIKWLALITWVLYGYGIISGDWMTRMLIVASVLNYLLFFGREHIREWRQGQRKRTFQTQAKRATAAAKHVCAVCGISSAESPRTLFRYCSKCSGQRCFCPEHIRDHEHVINKEPAV